MKKYKIEKILDVDTCTRIQIIKVLVNTEIQYYPIVQKKFLWFWYDSEQLKYELSEYYSKSRLSCAETLANKWKEAYLKMS